MPILAIGLCLASGYLLIAMSWPRQKTSPSELVMKLSLSTGVGLGIFSVTFFVARLLGLTHLVEVDCSLLLSLLIIYFLRHPRTPVRAHGPEYEDFDLPVWVRYVLTASCLMAVSAALYNAILRAAVHPHGEGWDAFAIWNLHARFLFLGGTHWQDGFSPIIPWSHPDYPLLLPAAIAHFWSYLGHDDPSVAAIVGIVFTCSTLALLVSSVALLRGPVAAMLAGLALASTPSFVEQGTSQYADVPVSFFILASVVLLHLGHRSQDGHDNSSGPLILAGLAAGFAAWTKNEGLLFLFAFVIAQLWAFAGRPSQDTTRNPSVRSWPVWGHVLLGSAPILLLIVWFKYSVAIPGDLFSSPATMIHKALTPSRYWIIVQWYAKELLRFGGWWVLPGTVAMVAFYILAPRHQRATRDPILHTFVTALALTFAGYFAIYLITPRDLYWHLRFSLNRLFLQLWPSAIFLFFLVAGRQFSQTESNSGPKESIC